MKKATVTLLGNTCLLEGILPSDRMKLYEELSFDIPNQFFILRARKLKTAKKLYFANKRCFAGKLPLDLASKILTSSYSISDSLKYFKLNLDSQAVEALERIKAILNKNEKWDGKKRFFNLNTNCIPGGLFLRTLNLLSSSGYSIDLKSRSILPKKFEIPSFNVELFPFQQKAVEVGLKRNGMFAIATSGGKTEIAAKLIQSRARNALFLCHRKDLLYQAKDRISNRLGVEIGQIGDGVFDLNNIVVATFQTISRILDIKYEEAEWVEYDDDLKERETKYDLRQWNDFLKSVEVLIVDEAHHLKAKIMYDVSEKIPAYYRYFFSATPYRDVPDDFQVEAAAGPVIYAKSLRPLIDEGYAVDPQIKIVELNKPKNYKITKDSREWQTIVKDEIIYNDQWNNTILKFAKAMMNKNIITLITVSFIKHGEILQSLIPGSVFLNGEHEASYRKDILDATRRREIPCLISTLIGEGIDIKCAQGLIFGYPKKAFSTVLQEIGRVVRKEDGKDKSFVIDIKHYAKYLRNHFSNRIKGYEREKLGYEFL